VEFPGTFSPRQSSCSALADALKKTSLQQCASHWQTPVQGPAHGGIPLETWTGGAVCGGGGVSSRWQGIACADGRVVALNLSGLGASGRLGALGPLTALTDLQLSGNNISGGAQLQSFCVDFHRSPLQTLTGLGSAARLRLLYICVLGHTYGSPLAHRV